MIPFIQRKNYNRIKFIKYLSNAEKTNQWSNYSASVQLLEKRARTLLEISDDKAIIATCSGTAALHALVFGIRRYKEKDLRVTTQDFNFPSASLGPCSGPIVVDFDTELNIQMGDSYLVDYGDIIIATNCFGHLQNLNYLLDQIKKYDKILIFDNAATPYSFYNNTNSCNLGLGSCISLHHTKPLGFGEGGLVIVNKEYEEVTRQAINFGFTQNEFNERSSNFKMSELAAAGILQWWDQVDLQAMMEKYQNNYYQLKYKLTTHSNGYSFPNYAEDKWFPFCMPWIHEEATSINQAYIKDRVVKKYYKPLRGYPNSTLIYNNILCYPIHEGLNAN